MRALGRAFPRRLQQGAALLAAMVTVTLVASFAASALWQQWRAIEVETAERARIQSAWILAGALDWSRLILREDSLARSGDGTDNLTEPWSVPLAEARLSTFLAAERGVAQVEDASTDTADAFLSGQITDQQALLNLRNLEHEGQVDPVALAQFARLFDYLGLPAGQLDAIARQMVQALASSSDADGGAGGHAGAAPLLPHSLAQLGWWGVPASTVAALSPHVALLPARTKLNLNTADPIALWASAENLPMAQAQQLVQAREARHFTSPGDAVKLLGTAPGITAGTHAVSSQYFEVRGQLRLEGVAVQERSLVLKQQGRALTLWRERGALPAIALQGSGPGGAPYNAAPPDTP